MHEKTEHLVSENVRETVRLRLQRLTSPKLCRKVIERRSESLPENVLDKKAAGVASAVRSALGYWGLPGGDLNSRILNRYYAVLQVSIAEQVASNDPDADLDSVQKHTERGHGLAYIDDAEAEFPKGCMIACMGVGHFKSYAKHLGLDLKHVIFPQRPRDWAKMSETERQKAVSLADLLRRVPELQPIIPECLDAPPLSFHVHHATRNMIVEAERTEEYIQRTGKFTLQAAADGPTKVTYAGITPQAGITAEFLASLALPFRNIRPAKEQDQDFLVGELEHPAGDLWWKHFPHYKSGYCGTSVIAPLWGQITDMFLIHFLILYGCSIVVRYLPSVWHRIEAGDLDDIRALLEHYMSVVDNVLPTIAVERITGVRLDVVQPGGFGALV